jgi:copper resistance protein B
LWLRLLTSHNGERRIGREGPVAAVAGQETQPQLAEEVRRHQPGKVWAVALVAALLLLVGGAFGGEKPGMPTTEGRRSHQESARRHEEDSPPEIEPPPLPEGKTLDEVLDRAASPPPPNYPEPVPDDRIYAFLLVEKFEWRISEDSSPNHLGWEAQGWIGGDFHKFWVKNEGEAVFDGPDEGETETDLLYSRLITPFWNLQLGAQYANEWTSDEYEDRASGVIALQGLTPYKFELDNSLYVSEDADVTLEVEAEYDLRITQRLVLQPRAELGFAAQDIPRREMAVGMTDVNLDLRLRYEIRREFAPYVGIRYQSLVGATHNLAEEAGEETDDVFFLVGLRFAF